VFVRFVSRGEAFRPPAPLEWVVLRATCRSPLHARDNRRSGVRADARPSGRIPLPLPTILAEAPRWHRGASLFGRRGRPSGLPRGLRVPRCGRPEGRPAYARDNWRSGVRADVRPSGRMPLPLPTNSRDAPMGRSVLSFAHSPSLDRTCCARMGRRSGLARCHRHNVRLRGTHSEEGLSV